MERYEIVKDYVYDQYLKIYNRIIKQNAVTHTAMVDFGAALLADMRNEDIELAKIAALLHDYAQFAQNCPHSQHAKLSAVFADEYLHQTNLFTEEEIHKITDAICFHSDKDRTDAPFCEILKDADVLARHLEDPSKKMSPAKEKRLQNISILIHQNSVCND